MFKDPKKKYEVVRNAISYELANFMFNYFLMLRDATALLMQQGIIVDSKDSFFRGSSFGTWNDPQMPNTFSKYGDPVFETLLVKLLPVTSKITQQNLIPCCSYARIYKKGDELARHKDRPSCEVSCTVHLGGDPWAFFIDPSGESGVKKRIDIARVILKKKPPKGVSIMLKPGDMVIYYGQLVEHWREPFKGNIHGQAFMHYNDPDGLHGQQNLFDGRPVLGVPRLQYHQR